MFHGETENSDGVMRSGSIRIKIGMGIIQHCIQVRLCSILNWGNLFSARVFTPPSCGLWLMTGRAEVNLCFENVVRRNCADPGFKTVIELMFYSHSELRRSSKGWFHLIPRIQYISSWISPTYIQWHNWISLFLRCSIHLELISVHCVLKIIIGKQIELFFVRLTISLRVVYPRMRIHISTITHRSFQYKNLN